MARPNKQKPPNPISAVIRSWIDSLEDSAAIEPARAELLISEAPKRWVIYEPMVLLPSGSFTSQLWAETLAKVSDDCRDNLWGRILRSIGAKTPEKTTHLAVNDGIPLTVSSAQSEAAGDRGDSPVGHENILRSPIGLRTLYGDFGPCRAQGSLVSHEDFERAFWVSTKQNGIHQTWAPRWTMFSRGNVKEKARLLAFHDVTKTRGDDDARMSHRERSSSELRGTWAVDLYAGIGYFVFSYARLGMKVLCWELNPWSVEGLRRGAQANGWSVKVVQGQELERSTPDLVSGADFTIVVFLEDNREAARRVQELRSRGLALPVSHVNCGLLPRSDDSWEAAREISGDIGGDGWLHLHENVGFKDIEHRRDEIQGLFDGWDQGDGRGWSTIVEHVELVKTFAPAVWHCVFDVCITKSKSNSSTAA